MKIKYAHGLDYLRKKKPTVFHFIMSKIIMKDFKPFVNSVIEN